MLLKPPDVHIVMPERAHLEAFLTALQMWSMGRHHPDEIVDVLRQDGVRKLIGSLQVALWCMRECGK